MAGDAGGKPVEWIFVSYRRLDTGGYAHSLWRALETRYGARSVFYDNNTIDIGVDFPARLAGAVRTARLLIAVIGSDWLRTLNERAAGPDVDYVREELRLALDQRKAGALVVQPVLIHPAKGFGRQSLAEALRDELGDLTIINAHTLHPGRGWDGDFDELCEKVINPICAALPAVHLAQGDAEKRLRRAVADLLAKSEMAAIRSAWKDDPLKDRRSADALDLLIEFSNAIESACAAWAQPGAALPPAQLPLVRNHCCEIAALLYRYAVDMAAVRVWHAGGKAAPVEQPGSAALVAAVADDASVRASPRSAGSTFHTDRTLNLDDGLDAGIGEDRVEQVFREFWAMAFETEAPKSPAGLQDAQMRDLRNRMTVLALKDRRHFGVTAPVATDDEHAALRRLAERLAVRAYGRTGQRDSPLLTHDEGLLATALCLCLEQLGKL